MKHRPYNRSRAGFSLSEMLVAVLILLMVAAVVAAGIPAARNAYMKVVNASNAEVLLSTAVSALRDELGTAMDVTVEDGMTVIYRSADTGSRSRLYIGTDPACIMLQEYTVPEDLSQGSSGQGESAGLTRRLVSEAASTSDLYVTYGSVDYDETEGVITFKDLWVYSGSGRVGTTGLDTLMIRVIAAS